MEVLSSNSKKKVNTNLTILTTSLLYEKLTEIVFVHLFYDNFRITISLILSLCFYSLSFYLFTSLLIVFSKEIIFVQPFCDNFLTTFLSYTHIMFLFSLFLFSISIVKREKESCLKWLFKYHYSFFN